jgi:NADH:ubiquinone oxidoreductase subunit 6 (subunit J)
MDNAAKAFYGLLALLVPVALVAGWVSAGPQGVVFAFFAILVLGGSLMCVWERSIVRSAFCLMGTFGGTAGMFLLLGADFLAMAQILIYVGGILALILFGVMLSPPDMSERKLPRVVGGLVFIGLGVAFVSAKVALTVEWATAAELPAPESHAREIGVGFLHPEQYVIPFELAAVLLTVALVAAVYIARRRKVDLEEERA